MDFKQYNTAHFFFGFNVIKFNHYFLPIIYISTGYQFELDLNHCNIVAAVSDGGRDGRTGRLLHHLDDLALLQRRHAAADNRLAPRADLNIGHNYFT